MRTLPAPTLRRVRLHGADEYPGKPLPRQVEFLHEVVYMGFRVEQYEVRFRAGLPVQPAQKAAHERAVRNGPAVIDEGIVERDQRTEDEGPARKPGEQPGQRHIEMTDIPDQHDVVAADREDILEQQLKAGQLQLERAQDKRDRSQVPAGLVAFLLPEGHVALQHLPAGPLQAFGERPVPRIVAFVGTEEADSAERGGCHDLTPAVPGRRSLPCAGPGGRSFRRSVPWRPAGCRGP